MISKNQLPSKATSWLIDKHFPYPLVINSNMEWTRYPLIQFKLNGSLILSLLTLSSIFILFISHSSNPFTFFILSSSSSSNINQHFSNKTAATNITINQRIIARPLLDDKKEEVATMCDLFEGKWVRDSRGSIYNNATCATLPPMRNCGLHGKDGGFVYWRWKPNGCEIPVFDPSVFLGIVRGKQMMLIGDSLARNQVESLLCLLSQAEIPVDTYKDANNKHRTWYFPTHNFTLMVIWTEFLVETTEITINGTPSNSFDINLDRMNTQWSTKLPQLHYAVINGGNWFTRKTYIHKSGKVIGCVHCREENIPKIAVPSALRMVFSAAFQYINNCYQCQSDLVTLLRTYSMSHFEHGSWFTGGYCNRTEPLNESEVSLNGEAWECREVQLEEFEKVNKMKRRRFGVLDVTKAMMVRADGHPGEHWMGRVMKHGSDCLHWCLPGPIDLWNELLLEVLKMNVV